MTRYEDPDDRSLALSVKKLASLAFLPVDEVADGFNLLLTAHFVTSSDGELRLRSYFEDTWLGRPQANGHRFAPRFSIALWNCHDAVV